MNGNACLIIILWLLTHAARCSSDYRVETALSSGEITGEGLVSYSSSRLEVVFCGLSAFLFTRTLNLGMAEVPTSPRQRWEYMSFDGTHYIPIGCIQSWNTWKSHGIPFSFSMPGKVMEIGSRFWKIHKKSWKLKDILSRNGVVPFFHLAF